MLLPKEEFSSEVLESEIERDSFEKTENLQLSNSEQAEDDIIILKEEKSVNDLRFGFVSNQEHCSPKYYFADKNKNRLSQNFYSIEQLDDIHYIVSDLDFMYSLGYDEWESQYGSKFVASDIDNFKFHYGVVSIKDKTVKVVVPIVYNRVVISNDDVVIVYSDALHTNDNKLGAINLDINSAQYGMTIIPTICDSLCDFNLDYKGYAYARINNTEGYLSKEIDVQRYNDYLANILEFGNKKIKYSEYLRRAEMAFSKILYSEEELKNNDKKLIKRK